MKAHLFLIIFLSLLTASLNAQDNTASVQLAAAIYEEEVTGNLDKAVELYQNILKEYPNDRPVAAKALYHLGLVNGKMGKQKASEYFTRLINSYPDQIEVVTLAKARLAEISQPAHAATGATESIMAIRRVWAGPEVDLEGGVSPDGRYVSFVDWSTGDLAIRDLVKGETRRLTHNHAEPVDIKDITEFADFSVFSPDGKQVAYAWCKDDGYYDLRIIGIDGSEPHIIHQSKDVDWIAPCGWSQDGKYILSLTDNLKTFAIALFSTVDSSVRIIKSYTGWQFPQLSLSPDGRWIAFDLAQEENPAKHDIYLIATDDAREVRLIEHPADDLNPVWTTDGKQLLFVSDRGGTLGLWLVPVLGGQAQGPPQLIKPDVGRIRPIGMTENGSLFYGLTAGTGKVYSAGYDPGSGTLTSDPVPAMKSYAGFNGTPDYSPDGESLACISLRGHTIGLQPGNRSLVIQSLKNGEERDIPLDFAPGWELKWSPDNRSVLIPGVNFDMHFNLYVIDVTTGALQTLNMPAPINNVDGQRKGWFPDQKSVYSVIKAPKDEQGRSQWRLVRYSLASGEMQDIYLYRSAEVELRSVTLSPDGKLFAAWRHNPGTGNFGLVLIPAEGGQPREVLSQQDAVEFKPGWRFQGLAWEPDGQHLLFAVKMAPDSKEMSLWRFAIADGSLVKAGSLPDKVYDIVVHPAGDKIAFSTREVKQEVWVMEGFLPK
ncbi:MAG: tetratricopeptide repeat protein [Bacteroidales bacterium]|nr:PD40 domain-containing protein [Lentimicrobiaceae bacterium]MDD5695373.1 tetratricopeptide repeat protein [Bacteroidales bacterium]